MTSSQHIDLESLRLLRAADRTGSISRAAAELGLAQPSASTRLARLERATGLSLLRRAPQGSSLTPEGHRFMLEAEKVLNAMDHLMTALTSMRHQTRSSLRVAASYTIAEYLVNRWLDASGLLRHDVHIGFEVGNSEAICHLVGRGVATVGFIETPSVPSDLDSQVVARDDLVVVVAPDHVWAQATTIEAQELLAGRLVMRESGSGTREYAEQCLEAALQLPRPKPTHEFGSTSAVKSAVMSGVGATVISRLAVREELASGRLTEVAVEGVAFPRQLRAVYLRGTQLTGAAAQLVRTATTVGT